MDLLPFLGKLGNGESDIESRSLTGFFCLNKYGLNVLFRCRFIHP